MKCVECPDFKILYNPIKGWDPGRAHCQKHDLIKDFMSKRELSRLVCVEESYGKAEEDTV